MIDTNLSVKRKLFPVFMKMVQDQLEKGGIKYAHSDVREATDIINDFDPKFGYASIMKYIMRDNNNDPRAEEDHAKVATYIFIMWIKHFGEKYLDEKQTNSKPTV